jgi:hypothetical protein
LKIFIASILLLTAVLAMAKPPRLSVDDLLSPPPRIIRTCCSFGADLSVARIPMVKRTDIICVENLGTHCYLGDNNEGNGIVYTRRGGFIDLGHLRDCADWTAYLYSLIKLEQTSDMEMVTELGTEGGKKSLLLDVPSKSDNYNCCEVAGKIAYELSLWHEIATWFGVSYVPLIPERYSSFSPEDLYSNLLGVKVGIKALKSHLPYNEAMTQIIRDMLDSLEVVTTFDETYAAMISVENVWWTGEKSLPNKKVLLERYVDTESYLLPWLIPNNQSSVVPFKLEKPDVNLSYYYQLQIELNRKIPVKTILSSCENKTITQEDFGAFMNYIKVEIAGLNQKMGKQVERKKKRKDKKLQLITEV